MSKENRILRVKELMNLTKDLRTAAKFGKFPFARLNTANEMLKAYYSMHGITNLRTFQDWKKDGYNIKKGVKAVCLWGKPVRHQIQDENGDMVTVNVVDNNGRLFYPICYLFAENQVYKVND